MSGISNKIDHGMAWHGVTGLLQRVITDQSRAEQSRFQWNGRNIAYRVSSPPTPITKSKSRGRDASPFRLHAISTSPLCGPVRQTSREKVLVS